MRILTLAIAITVSACATSEDPADGGFVSGVTGLTSGGYDARIAERKDAVAVAEAEQSNLSAELAALRLEWRKARSALLAQRSESAAKGVALDPTLNAEVNSALGRKLPGGDALTEAEGLRAAIANARKLSAALAAASG